MESVWLVLTFETDGEGVEDISGSGTCLEHKDDTDELSFCDLGFVDDSSEVVEVISNWS